MADEKQLSTRQNAIWWLDQPGGTMYLLDCGNLGSLDEVETALTPYFCWNAERTAKVVIGETLGDPEKIAFEIEFPRYLARSILEQGENCPGAILWTESKCGRVDDFSSADIGEIIQHVKRAGRGWTGLSDRGDVPTLVKIRLEAWPPVLDIDLLVLARVATTEAQALNDVFGNTDSSCGGDCGTAKTRAQYLGIACDAAGGATGDELFSTDTGETWAIGAADPFAVGLNTMAGIEIPYNNGRRWIVGREGTGAVQGLMAHSDNAGAAWTTVNIGGAAAGHGPVFGHGIYAKDSTHIWVASHGGYIYKSINAGVSYVAKEAGSIHAGDNYFVHFADKSYGLVGGAAGVISISSDGGESWQAGGIPVASAARCGWRFNDKLCLVGCDNGNMYRSVDGGLTWTNPYTLGNPWPAGALRSMWFVNDYQGFLVHNTGGPVGTLYKTNNGGTTWEALATPTNVGLNSVWASTANLAFVVGEAQGGTGFIGKVNASYV